MNLAILQRMIRDGDVSIQALHYLLDCKSECEWLDYKESLNLGSDAQVAAFSRDMLALRNVGGGYQIIGVKERTWEPVGLEESLPYDSKLLRDKVRKGSGINLQIDIVQHSWAYKK
jgi:predicted HTH transcriptional regulator